MYATKLKKATYYKYIIKAYKLVDGKKVITDTSVAVHSITKGGKYGVAKAVSIIKIGNKKNDTEVTLKKGKTAQITAIEIKKDKKIKLDLLKDAIEKIGKWPTLCVEVDMFTTVTTWNDPFNEMQVLFS